MSEPQNRRPNCATAKTTNHKAQSATGNHHARRDTAVKTSTSDKGKAWARKNEKNRRWEWRKRAYSGARAAATASRTTPRLLLTWAGKRVSRVSAGDGTQSREAPIQFLDLPERSRPRRKNGLQWPLACALCPPQTPLPLPVPPNTSPGCEIILITIRRFNVWSNGFFGIFDSVYYTNISIIYGIVLVYDLSVSGRELGWKCFHFGPSIFLILYFLHSISNYSNPRPPSYAKGSNGCCGPFAGFSLGG